MIKRIFIPLFVLLFATGTALAATQTPEAALRQNVEQLQSLIRKNHAQYKADPQSFYKVVNEVVVPRFDVPYITRLVLGRYARQASAKQLAAFQDAFKTMLIRSYANSLLDNADSTKVEWKPSRTPADAKRATVETMLVRDNGQKFPINFSVRLVDGSWKIYDITVGGISLVLNFRSQIDAEIRKNGLDAVIKRMQRTQAQHSPTQGKS